LPEYFLKGKRMRNLILALFGVLMSATALAGGSVELRMAEDVTHESTVFELGLPVREPIASQVTYVSWTGYACNPEAPEGNTARTEQGVELALKHAIVGLGGKLEFSPELKKFQKSLYASVSTKLW
jgi:hypothetical protein